MEGEGSEPERFRERGREEEQDGVGVGEDIKRNGGRGREFVHTSVCESVQGRAWGEGLWLLGSPVP